MLFENFCDTSHVVVYHSLNEVSNVGALGTSLRQLPFGDIVLTEARFIGLLKVMWTSFVFGCDIPHRSALLTVSKGKVKK